MKILYISSSVYPIHSSGVSINLKNICDELIKLGHQVYIFALTADKRYKNKSINNYKFKNCNVRLIVNYNTIDDALYNYKVESYNNTKIEYQFLVYLKEISPDIVHFHSIQGLGANLIKLAKLNHYPTILTMHDWWWLYPSQFIYIRKKHNIQDKQKYKKYDSNGNNNSYKDGNYLNFIENRKKYLLNILQNYTDCVICVSDFLKEYLLLNNIKIKLLIVQKNGVEIPKIISSNLKQKNEKIIFGFLGGKSNIKGHNIVINTFNHLNNKKYELKIYGPGIKVEKPLKKLFNYIKNLEIKKLFNKIIEKINRERIQITYQNNIKYMREFRLEDKDKIFQEFDVLIANSLVKESSSLVVREALIRQIPVIISKSGGPEEVIRNNYNGFILENNTSQELYKIINQLDYKIINKWKINIKKNPYNFTCKEQTKKLLKIYNKIIYYK